MRILITGAGGFVGGTLLSQAARLPDWDFLVFTRRFSSWSGVGRPIPLSLNLDIWSSDTNRFLTGVDVVLHLAALNATRDQYDLTRFLKANSDFTVKLAEAAADRGVGHFIFVSTVKVSGDRSADQPFDRYTEYSPTDAYAKSKCDAEKHLFQLASQSSMKISIVRPPPIVGRGVKGNVRSLANAILNGIPLPFGALRLNRRSFIGALDFSDLLFRIILSPTSGLGPYLAQSGSPLSTATFIESLARGLGKAVRMPAIPPRLLQAGFTAVGARDAFARLSSNLELDDNDTRYEMSWEPKFGLDQEFAEIGKELSMRT